MDLSPLFAYLGNLLSGLFLATGSQLSLTSLISAFLVAAVFLGWRRRARKRPVRLKTIARALFPRRLARHASTRADLGFLLSYMFVYGSVLGWAVLSYQLLTNGVIAGLTNIFGPVAPSGLPVFISRSIVTLVLFLAYELGYWLNHYLSHRIPVLWEFHKVHHTATVLTPLTNFRVHPVYMWIFGNILALATGTANGVANYLLGETAYQYALTDTNIILVFFIHLYVHLQHTQVWIPFRGVAGRVFMSPAHHQVHHSADPRHFDKNLGSCLALWDWMFGTLYVPEKNPGKMRFGAEPDNAAVHTIGEALVGPFVRAAAHLKPVLQRPTPPSALPARDRTAA